MLAGALEALSSGDRISIPSSLWRLQPLYRFNDGVLMTAVSRQSWESSNCDAEISTNNRLMPSDGC